MSATKIRNRQGYGRCQVGTFRESSIAASNGATIWRYVAARQAAPVCIPPPHLTDELKPRQWLGGNFTSPRTPACAMNPGGL